MMNHTTTTTMNQTNIHITLILNHHLPPSRPRTLPPLPASLARRLALKKGHILRLEKTRHRVTSNGTLDRRRSRSISTSLKPSTSLIWRQAGMLNG
jgi:hypothetical protein